MAQVHVAMITRSRPARHQPLLPAKDCQRRQHLERAQGHASQGQGLKESRDLAERLHEHAMRGRVA